MSTLSGLFRLNMSDLVKGLVVAVTSAVFTTVAQLINAPGFDLYTFDWALVLKIAVSAAVGYLGKNLITDAEGTVHLGVAKIEL